MKALTCEMCGSTNLLKQDGVFVCQSCGTKYSVEEAKKMMVEGTVDVNVAVKVDTSEELKNLYEVARRAIKGNNYEQAQRYYDMILVKDPKSWEATFFATYCATSTCKIGQIGSAANKLEGCLDFVCELIKKEVHDESEQKRALEEVSLRCASIASSLALSASTHYMGLPLSIRENHAAEYAYNLTECVYIVYSMGNYMEKFWGDKYGKMAAVVWQRGINMHNEYIKYVEDKSNHIKIINAYIDKIRKYDPEYKAPEIDTGAIGCGGLLIQTVIALLILWAIFSWTGILPTLMEGFGL